MIISYRKCQVVQQVSLKLSLDCFHVTDSPLSVIKHSRTCKVLFIDFPLEEGTI